MRHLTLFLAVLFLPLTELAQDAPISISDTPSDARITERLTGI